MRYCGEALVILAYGPEPLSTFCSSSLLNPVCSQVFRKDKYSEDVSFTKRKTDYFVTLWCNKKK